MGLYDSVLHVPLIARIPGIGPRRVPDVVSLVDVMPTVLDVMKIEGPPSGGSSLLAEMNGRRRPVERDAYAESMYPMRVEQPAMRALRDGRFKLIEGAAPALFDLQTDPHETHDVSVERAFVASAMTRQLAILSGRPAAPGPDRTSRDVRERLAALGYVAPVHER